MAEEIVIPAEYKETIRRCSVTVKAGPASDPRDIVEVDWSNVLMGQQSAGFLFLLGFEPRAVPQGKWLDESLQYAPPPIWVSNEPYIQALEAENKALKAQLAKK